jgi:hypothetical protein
MEVFKKIINHKKYEREKCERCGKQYTQYTDIPDGEYIWCESCYIIKKDFTNWTSGNEKIDDLIQSKFDHYIHYSMVNDIVFEWIPYNQFYYFKIISKNKFAEVYSAVWKDGPLFYDNKWTRDSYAGVTLKCLRNSSDIELLNEVCYS